MACDYCVKEHNLISGEDWRVFIRGSRLVCTVDADVHDYKEISACPVCCAPLAQQEPLLVERLKSMSAEPLKHWVWIENFKSPDGLADIGYMRASADWSVGECFCCGWPGIGYAFKYDDYGITWNAYTHKPREAPNDATV